MDTYEYAVQIVKKLVRAGHTAYFAGGYVRDYLMGHPSNDIDIATNASPDKILDLFPRTILVGLNFGVVVVLVDSHQFEVSTFRKDFQYLDGRRPEHIEFASAKEDALRRDFTINGMFYDPLEEIVHDFVGGTQDIKKKIIRAIGNPHERFVEDRLRMIRAVRFTTRFGFTIDPETQQAIIENANTLFPAVAMERVWQEFNKMVEGPNFDQALIEMYRLGLLSEIFPDLKDVGLKTIKKYVSSFVYFPEGCPTIFYLLELFPETPLPRLIDICRILKVPNRDIKLVELITLARRLVESSKKNERSVETHEWVYFYAHPDSQVCLKVIAARLPADQQGPFLQVHDYRRQEYASHIQRIQLGKPLVTAALLQAHGISPGKPMGLLLKEAERMVINHNRDNAESIIDLLKKTPHWPESQYDAHHK